jgi:hypothetical protein
MIAMKGIQKLFSKMLLIKAIEKSTFNLLSEKLIEVIDEEYIQYAGE